MQSSEHSYKHGLVLLEKLKLVEGCVSAWVGKERFTHISHEPDTCGIERCIIFVSCSR